jgi:hypothetical protein
MIDHIVCWIGMTNDHLWHASNLRARLQPVVTAHDQDRRRVKAERTGSVSKMAAQTRKASRMTVRAGSMSCIAVRAQTASRTPVADGINVVATVTTDSPWNPTPRRCCGTAHRRPGPPPWNNTPATEPPQWDRRPLILICCHDLLSDLN